MKLKHISYSNPFNIIALVILILVLPLLHEASAQSKEDTRYINRKSVGGFVSAGFPLYELEEGTKYNPFIIGGSIHLPLYQTSKVFGLGVGLLPQVGFVPYNNEMEYEFGFNITFTFGFQISVNSILSINLGAGPHYYTADIARQAAGFLFSDHLNLAYQHQFNTFEISFTIGIRHISNAGMDYPNRGIENIGFGLALAKLLKI